MNHADSNQTASLGWRCGHSLFGLGLAVVCAVLTGCGGGNTKIETCPDQYAAPNHKYEGSDIVVMYVPKQNYTEYDYQTASGDVPIPLAKPDPVYREDVPTKRAPGRGLPDGTVHLGSEDNKPVYVTGLQCYTIDAQQIVTTAEAALRHDIARSYPNATHIAVLNIAVEHSYGQPPESSMAPASILIDYVWYQVPAEEGWTPPTTLTDGGKAGDLIALYSFLAASENIANRKMEKPGDQRTEAQMAASSSITQLQSRLDQIDSDNPRPTPPPDSPPAPVTAFEMVAQDSTAVRISWPAIMEEGVTVEILRGPTSDKVTDSIYTTQEVGESGHIDTGLLPTRTYFYTLVTANAAGKSKAPPPKDIRMPGTPRARPPAPRRPCATMHTETGTREYYVEDYERAVPASMGYPREWELFYITGAMEYAVEFRWKRDGDVVLIQLRNTTNDALSCRVQFQATLPEHWRACSGVEGSLTESSGVYDERLEPNSIKEITWSQPLGEGSRVSSVEARVTGDNLGIWKAE